MATSVPAPKAIRKATPARRVGNASAGRHSKSASGCMPESTPVPRVFKQNWELAEAASSPASSMPSSHSRASFKPRPPIRISTSPTAAAAARSAMAPSPSEAAKLQMALQRPRPSSPSPRSTCPRTCPEPQKTPLLKAAPGPPRTFRDSGARAARWSGPDSACSAPAPAPAAATAQEVPEGASMLAAPCANASSRSVAERSRAVTTAMTAMPSSSLHQREVNKRGR
mmetsp:Transcript_112959/g.364693  ORF Transcript_112959/g.364693 Transcript_112959/m.364693 type:complete len:226 (-) Transcript_112959:381-1058(-)